MLKQLYLRLGNLSSFCMLHLMPIKGVERIVKLRVRYFPEDLVRAKQRLIKISKRSLFILILISWLSSWGLKTFFASPICPRHCNCWSISPLNRLRRVLLSVHKKEGKRLKTLSFFSLRASILMLNSCLMWLF